jgi:KAP family P-loop domain
MALEIDRATREPVMPVPAKSPLPVNSPAAANSPAATKSPAPPPRPSREPLLIASSTEAADVAEVASALQPLIELCVSEATQTPFRVGLIGPHGAGKSFALRRLAESIGDLGSRAPGAGISRPREIVVATLDAAGIGAEGQGGFDPASALASAVFVALESGRDGANYGALADEASHGAGDPRRAAAAATERQDEISRRLDAERAQREELEAKRAKLGESLIYDTPGSRVDAMIRANRSMIEARLRRFGYSGDDMGQTFRDLLFDHAGAGAGSKFGLFLRSTWAFRGQVTLLLIAIVALIAAAGVERLRAANDGGLIAGIGAGFAPIADFLTAHDDWVSRGQTALIGIAILALFFNLWRATGFAALLIRGLGLLNIDLRERRRDLDQTVARIERRIATLTSEAQSASDRADQLMKRVGGATPVARGPGPAFLQALHTPAKASRDFFAELGRLMLFSGEAARPKRIVIVIDNLETLPADKAVRLIDALAALVGTGMAAIVACDPGRLAPSDPRLISRDRFDLVFNLAAFSVANSMRLAARMIAEGGRAGVGAPEPSVLKSIAEPLSAAETALLAALAPLTDAGPAALKRLYNVYRLARTANAPRPLVAVMVAALQSSRPRSPVPAIDSNRQSSPPN